MKKLTMIAALVGLLAVPMTASSKTLNNKFGIGADAGAQGAGISLKYWMGHFGMQAVLGLVSAGNDDSSSFDFDFGLRLQGNVARAKNTNLFAGAGFGMRLQSSEAGDTSTDSTRLNIELFIGAEHFFGNHFSVHGRAGLRIDLAENDGDNTSITLGGNSGIGDFGFTFYF